MTTTDMRTDDELAGKNIINLMDVNASAARFKVISHNKIKGKSTTKSRRGNDEQKHT